MVKKNCVSKIFFLFILTFSILNFEGCGSSIVLDDMAKEATVSGMANTSSDLASSENKLRHLIGIQDVIATQDTDSVGKSYHISEDHFEQAMFESLKYSGFDPIDAKDARYLLTANLLKID